MKKWHFLSIGMVAIHLIYPLCNLIAEELDMNFEFYNQLAYEIVVTALFFTAGIVQLVKKTPPTYWDWFLIPAVLLNGALLVANAGYLPLVFMVVNLLCAGILIFRHKGWGKVFMTAACVIAAYFMILWGLIACFFDKWTADLEDILYQVESPSGSYTAHVLLVHRMHDKKIGVEVVKNGRVSVLFGEFRHNPKHLRIGIVREHDPIQVSWVDEDTLCINGKIYEID